MEHTVLCSISRVFSFIGSVTLFLLGSKEVIEAVRYAFQHNVDSGNHSVVVGMVIGAIDLYLIGIVLLIFTFGVYFLRKQID